MDRIDRGILAALESDGRQSFAVLADAVGLSKTSCWARVQALERDGAIKAYGIAIDAAALDLRLTAHVQVMIDPARREEFEKSVFDVPAILDCATVAGDADYLLKVVAPDVTQLDWFLRNILSMLPGLQRSSTTIALQSIKNGASLVAAADSFQPKRHRR